jgi:hypothetical protein
MSGTFGEEFFWQKSVVIRGFQLGPSGFDRELRAHKRLVATKVLQSTGVLRAVLRNSVEIERSSMPLSARIGRVRWAAGTILRGRADRATAKRGTWRAWTRTDGTGCKTLEAG